jgi:hypothetical protein
MQGRTDAVAAPRPRTSRATSLSARQRRRELADLIATGIVRAVAGRAESNAESIVFAEDSAVSGLALSPELRLSVHTVGPRNVPDRNESKAGEHA